MSQAYSDPSRSNDPYALPDIEVWQDEVAELDCDCGFYEVPSSHAFAVEDECDCPSCGKAVLPKATKNLKWFYWFCFPGCLPESDSHGPFDSKADALSDARKD
jgi:hypothetical protein